VLTQCPACLTIFRVTGPILRMGHGQVRCGRCEQQFDALERLLDDEEEAMQTGEMHALKRAVTSPSSTATESSPSKLAIESSFAPKAAAHIDAPKIEASDHESLEGERLDEQSAETTFRDTETSVGAEKWVDESATLPPVPDDVVIPAAAASAGDESSGVRAEIEDSSPITHALTEREELDLLSGARRRTTIHQERKGLWTGLSLTFALVLLLQIVHHYRQDLVRHPRIGGVMTRVYGALGIPLAQAWDLTAYEIQQWGATSDPAIPGTLRVRATIGNVAGFAQPYPVLRFVLEDRWGDAVGSRDFAPQEYLEPGTPVDRLLSPNQRATVDVAIMDPGQDAVGFRWSICLPQPEGMQCESDVARG
jgi:predicted Zn finger-like uncharacterized protein